jgi:hypothetical protein
MSEAPPAQRLFVGARLMPVKNKNYGLCGDTSVLYLPRIENLALDMLRAERASRRLETFASCTQSGSPQAALRNGEI